MLGANDSIRTRELGTRLALTSGAITMLVDRLERAGWVAVAGILAAAAEAAAAAVAELRR